MGFFIGILNLYILFMKIQGIYKIVNKINNKIYIGRSLNIEKRFREHKHAEKAKVPHPYPIARAINKYGIDNFEFMIIEVVTDYMKLDERELYWINHYKSNDPSYGYNIRIDCRNNKGFKHTKETKDILSAITKKQWENPEFRKAISEFGRKRLKDPEVQKKMQEASKSKTYYGHTGHKHSEKAREKISKGRKGKPAWNKGLKMSDEYRQKRSKSKKKMWANIKSNDNLDFFNQGNRNSNISTVLQEQISSQHLFN